MNDNLTAYSAEAYEQGIQQTMPFYSQFHEQIIDLVKHVKPQPRRWLDTGCGPGTLVNSAHQAFPSSQFMIADPSAHMLVRAEENLQHIQDLQVLGELGTLQLRLAPEQAPEVISASLSHHYFQPEERRAAAKHCYQLLAEGGLYVYFENIRPATAEGERIALARWRAYELAQGKSPEEVEHHLSRYDKFFFPVRIEEHLENLQQAGFRCVELFWRSQMQAGFYAIK